MSRRRKQTQAAPPAPPPRPWWRGWPIVLIIAVPLLGAALVALGLRAGVAPAGAPQGSAGGVALDCQTLPAFAERLGYADRLAISTSERAFVGLVIFDGRVPLTAPPSERAIHQEPSWDDAGTLGPFVRDRAGNIYTAPVPRTAIGDVPAGSQNTIYRVDTQTGEMAPFVTLPDAPAPGPENPFGIVGITYDCDSDSLYVSTIAGSTSASERGRIVRVDLATREATDQVVDVDAIGLGVFTGSSGKRLYFGLAREASVASVALDAAGDATGEIRDEVSVADAGAGIGVPRVRRFVFGPQSMALYVVPFSYNLRAVSEQQQVVLYYEYDAAADAWVRVSAPGQ